MSIDDFVVTASSTHTGEAQNVLNYKIEEPGPVFETDYELPPWVQIDMVEGRFVKSVTLYGKESAKLRNIYAIISETCKCSTFFDFYCHPQRI